MTESRQERPAAIADLSPRLRRELATVIAMIKMYCRSHHRTNSTRCEHCNALKAYVARRLVKCSFADQKPTCAKCTVHCYSPAMRAEIIKVMRFSGPRMVFFHPYLAFRHVFDGRRAAKKLQRPVSQTSSHQGESLS